MWDGFKLFEFWIGGFKEFQFQMLGFLDGWVIKVMELMMGFIYYIELIKLAGLSL